MKCLLEEPLYNRALKISEKEVVLACKLSQIETDWQGLVHEEDASINFSTLE